MITACDPEPPDTPDGGPGTGGKATGGAPTGGTSTGGTPTGGKATGGTTATGGSGGAWHGCQATISDATLTNEYTT